MLTSILASLAISAFTLQGGGPTATRPPRTRPLRGSLERRLTTLLDQPPCDRATWGVYVHDDQGRVLFNRNADRYRVPASNTKLVVTAVASALLPPDYRVRTSAYVNGRLADGVLYGDLVIYGRGDPTFSERCSGLDTLAAAMCDSAFTAINRLPHPAPPHAAHRIPRN